MFVMNPLVVRRFWAYDILHATVFSRSSAGGDVLREIFPRNDVDERARVVDCLTEEPIEPSEPLFVVGGMGYSRGSVERMRRSSSNDPFTRRAIDWESGDVDSKTPPERLRLRGGDDDFPLCAWCSLSEGVVFDIHDFKRIGVLAGLANEKKCGPGHASALLKSYVALAGGEEILSELEMACAARELQTHENVICR